MTSCKSQIGDWATNSTPRTIGHPLSQDKRLRQDKYKNRPEERPGHSEIMPMSTLRISSGKCQGLALPGILQTSTRTLFCVLILFSDTAHAEKHTTINDALPKSRDIKKLILIYWYLAIRRVDKPHYTFFVRANCCYLNCACCSK